MRQRLGLADDQIVLLFVARRMASRSEGRPDDGRMALAAGVLVVGAAVSLLGLTQDRCWDASGSANDPAYTVVTCAPVGQAPAVPLPGAWATGYDSGVGTPLGVLVEVILLGSALAIVVASGDPADQVQHSST